MRSSLVLAASSLLGLLAACGAPPAPTDPASTTPSARPSASATPSIVVAPKAPEPKIGVIATISEQEGIDIDHGRPGSVLTRGADGSVRFAHGFLRAIAPADATKDFVAESVVTGAPYSPLALTAATLAWETTFWNAPFAARPLLTRWETIERVGQFATVAALEGATWKTVGTDIAYLAVVERAGTSLTIQVSTPRPLGNCSFENPDCKMAKGKPPAFVDVATLADPKSKAVVPAIPKNFCPEGLVANKRGDLFVTGYDCDQDTPQYAYYAPGAMTATVSALPETRGNSSLAVTETGTLYVAANDQLLAVTPGSAPLPLKVPAPSGILFDAVAVDPSGALWVATHDAGGNHDAPVGAVFSRASAPNSPFVAVDGPWAAKHAYCTILGFEVSDPSDPLFLGQNCSVAKHAAENGGSGTIDILRKTLRVAPQKLPSLREQIATYEGTRTRLTVEDASKCEEKLALVVIPADKKADAEAILKKAKKTEELEVKAARIGGKPSLAVFSQFDAGNYAPKGANALKKLFAPTGATLVCGVPVPAE
jgi:hypothetical protein